MTEFRSDEEKTRVALAMLDGMADLWFAESGFEKCNFPEPVVRAVKLAHHEGLYIGRGSAVDGKKALLEAAVHAEAVMSIIEPRSDKKEYLETLFELRAAIAAAEA